MTKVCVCTGTRAEYGLLSKLIDKLYRHADCELQLLVTGMHLSEKYGHTVDNIRADGYPIAAEIPLPLEDDSPEGICKAMGVATAGMGEAFARLQPDVLVILGDRFESLCAAQAALISRIPVAHIHGGERTEGLIDEGIRHAITKMSHLHFAATEEYMQRIIQMGENPQHVYHVGAPGIEVLKSVEQLSRQALSDSLNFTIREENFLITYHPETLLAGQAEKSMTALLEALRHFPDASMLISYPNADTDNDVIVRALETFAETHSDRVKLVKSLGQQRYISAMYLSQVVIGNSSSGLIEAPSVGTPTVNIGVRQQGRIAPDSVINCDVEASAIGDAIALALSEEKQKLAARKQNPYDGGETAENILQIILATDFSSLIIKPFFDLETPRSC